MNKIADFEYVVRELILIKEDYKNNKELCKKIDNILKQTYTNMTVVSDIIENNIKQGEI